MLISEIENKEVRERAEFYARTMPAADRGKGDKSVLGGAFYWYDTTEGHDFWDSVDDGEDMSLPKAAPTEFDMPRLPASWRYTGQYRQPIDGEYYFYCGEVKHCKGRTAGWYPIVRYVGVES